MASGETPHISGKAGAHSISRQSSPLNPGRYKQSKIIACSTASGMGSLGRMPSRSHNSRTPDSGKRRRQKRTRDRYHDCHDLSRLRGRIRCKLLILLWWRRGELNPRPKMLVVKRTTCVSGSLFFDLRFKTGESGGDLARLDLDRRLRTEAFGLSRKMTFAHHRAGSVAGTAT